MGNTWETLQAAVRGRGASAAVAAAPETIRHLAGIHIPSQTMIRRRLAFVLVPAEGPSTLLVQAVLEGTSRARAEVPRVATYVTDPVGAMAALLTEQRLDRGVVLAELDFLPAADTAKLGRAIPHARLEDAGDLFRAARRVRSPTEVEAHRRYARAAERAIEIAFSLAAGGGLTEHHVYARMQDAMSSLQDGIIPFLTLSSGPERTLQIHAHPSERVIREGDLLLVDMVGFFGGIYTDVARTVVVGRASPAQRTMYHRVRAVQREVIATLRPGMIAEEVYDRFLESVRAHGLNFTYRYVGHSTGYQVVEDPVLTPGNSEPLQAGMVLCVEVKDVEPGVGGVHLEDMLLLTAEGAEIWTDLMAADEILEIG
jgi:Xaa-Pro dipeptidase